MSNRVDVELTGRKFGKWEVLKRAEFTKNGSQAWWCRCECGTEKKVVQSNLLQGLSTMCRDCAFKPLPYPLGEVPYPYWREIYLGALERGLAVLISPKEAYALLERQGFKCALSGVPIQLPKDIKDTQTASLDRINSAVDYCMDNLQWVHRDVNYMKNVFSTSHFVNFCRLVAVANPQISLLGMEDLSFALPSLKPTNRKKLTSKQVQEEWKRTGLWRGQKGKHVRRKIVSQ